MERNLELLILLGFLNLLIGLSNADWNIIVEHRGKHKLDISLKNYCESWRMNVELNNIRGYDVVPEECVDYIGKYMTSTQYHMDCERALEECGIYLNSCFDCREDGDCNGDGKDDAWIFDVDDTLLSTVPYYKSHRFGGDQLNTSSLEEWMREKKGTALEHSRNLFKEIKGRGLKIFLISSRAEYLRDATVDNLVKAGYYGWTGLILRNWEDNCKTVQEYKTEQRKRLIDRGYQIWGIVGDQWSSLQGHHLSTDTRTFKLPNPMYYAV